MAFICLGELALRATQGNRSASNEVLPQVEYVEPQMFQIAPLEYFIIYGSYPGCHSFSIYSTIRSYLFKRLYVNFTIFLWCDN